MLFYIVSILLVINFEALVLSLNLNTNETIFSTSHVGESDTTWNNNIAPKYSWYIPKYFSKIEFGKGIEAKVKSIDYQYYAVAWPQDSPNDVVNRILSKGMSPFPGKSVTVYPDEIVEDLLFEQKKKTSKVLSSIQSNKIDYETTQISHSKQSLIKKKDVFFEYYNPFSFLHYDTQMTICSAISMFQKPDVLIFGIGLDSSLFCKATTDIHPLSNIYFIENDEKWRKKSQWITKDISSRCHVIDMNYETNLEEWMNYLGREDELASKIISQLPTAIQKTFFDVILVDGPVGSKFGQHGRMSSLSAASKLIRQDGMGVVFVDDFHRFVELIFGRYLFRSKFGIERHIMGWGNTRQTVYFTRNEEFKKNFQNPIIMNASDGGVHGEKLKSRKIQDYREKNFNLLQKFWSKTMETI